MKFLFAFICLSNKYFSSVQLVFAQLYEEKLDFLRLLLCLSKTRDGRERPASKWKCITFCLFYKQCIFWLVKFFSKKTSIGIIIHQIPMQLIRKIIFDFKIIFKSVGVVIRIYTLWENNTVGFVKLLSKNMNFLFKIQQKSWIEYYKKI